MAEINKQSVHALSALARLGISQEKEEKLSTDLKAIVNYFQEIQAADFTNKKSRTETAASVNIFRDDTSSSFDFDKEKLIAAFPGKENEFLKIPPVFGFTDR
jgi:aspartyl/glutamyl-tRNA(Asn/Gln) amidotransferase C subunit